MATITSRSPIYDGQGNITGYTVYYSDGTTGKQNTLGGTVSAPTSTSTTTSTTQTPTYSAPASSTYTVGQVIQGGAANTDGTNHYVYTYLGGDKWSVGDTAHGTFPGATKTTQEVTGSSAPSTSTSTTSTSSSGVQPPTVALQPGSTDTAAVKQLQDYLVSKGLLTEAQKNTGYGTYGPATTAAVLSLQKQLGIDYSSGPGYFGPKTLAAIGSSGTSASNIPPELATLLNNDSNLTADQKSIISNIYGAVSSSDTDRAARIKAAMAAATAYSDPYFKAQIRLATDALSRGLSKNEGDLAFSEKQLTDALSELTANTTASKGQLSFQHEQELQQLATKYETDLNTTRDNLAAAGFTSSSKRARAEDILTTNNEGLVESSNKTYGYQTGNLDSALASKQVSTADEIANLRRLNESGALDLYRTTEATVGSSNLPPVDNLTPLGGIGGTIPYNQVKDAASFASNFVN